jgi:hypothetical protein
MANGGSHSLGLSSSDVKVHCQDPFYLERKLVSRRFIWLGLCDHLLADELASPLCRLALGVDLLSVGLRSLSLLKGVPPLRWLLGV